MDSLWEILVLEGNPGLWRNIVVDVRRILRIGREPACADWLAMTEEAGDEFLCLSFRAPQSKIGIKDTPNS